MSKNKEYNTSERKYIITIRNKNRSEAMYEFSQKINNETQNIFLGKQKTTTSCRIQIDISDNLILIGNNEKDQRNGFKYSNIQLKKIATKKTEMMNIS